ncbi:crotonase/enoyl-CoA hydratase family protein [Alterisphingorhabdus coralli]|uniref:Crotonase/enoyl-CoA hydratase family protein n=1 Tax=Alterisphingorhabdus coralli TaxID=3071408 RepID=A0AA97I161_9SPHN|nr:crotonase/enoyl-CoA hydratase family protein [Parasphingorhabdus sp. SCSIO 66989]WOE76399.1 crotonase/enoyl-CoA hydratase family protein [Parasphingorhabdus sp. SCSIO 66989]
MSEVLTDIQDGFIVVTINRPDAKNAMTKAAAEGIRAAMEQLDNDNSLNAGILTGAGGTFCSGMDLKGFLRGESPMVPGYGFGGITEKGPEKPLIAAVEGYALAGGLELALACDLCVANDKAKFGIPEVKRSLVAAAGGVLKLQHVVGKRLAMEMALTGDFYTAQRAYEMGFVNRVTDGPALDAAMELAATVAANGPLALKATKRIINESYDWAEEEAWKKQAEITAPVFTSQDAKEGSLAFAEKRKPNWQGK